MKSMYPVLLLVIVVQAQCAASTGDRRLLQAPGNEPRVTAQSVDPNASHAGGDLPPEFQSLYEPTATPQAPGTAGATPTGTPQPVIGALHFVFFLVGIVPHASTFFIYQLITRSTYQACIPTHQSTNASKQCFRHVDQSVGPAPRIHSTRPHSRSTGQHAHAAPGTPGPGNNHVSAGAGAL
jgi:hypothetical protein